MEQGYFRLAGVGELMLLFDGCIWVHFVVDPESIPVSHFPKTGKGIYHS